MFVHRAIQAAQLRFVILKPYIMEHLLKSNLQTMMMMMMMMNRRISTEIARNSYYIIFHTPVLHPALCFCRPEQWHLSCCASRLDETKFNVSSYINILERQLIKFLGTLLQINLFHLRFYCNIKC